MFEEYGLLFLMGRLPEHSVKRGGGFLTMNLKKKFFFQFYCNWIAIQCCVNFCCTAKWINHTYTHITSFWSFLPVRVTAEHCVVFSVLYNLLNRLLLSLLYIVSVVYICQSQYPFSSHPPPQMHVWIILFLRKISEVGSRRKEKCRTACPAYTF